MTLSFENKVALVTGAGSGMGLATAEAFASAGAAVALVDVNEPAVRKLAEQMVSAGHKAIAITCDVTDEAQVKRMVEQTVSAFGRLDAAFNNAGVQSLAVETADTTSEEFDRVNAINLRSVWLCMKYELLQVKEKFHEWGPGHSLWESRVLGNFPKQAQDALISLTWLEQAKQRELRADQQECLLTAGIDVAGPGEDETVLAIRQGNNIIEIRSFRQQDARGELVAALLPYQARLGLVNVDAAGIGWYMAQHLAEYFRVQAINVGQAATDSERFVNLKAELYWGVRMRFESCDVAGLMDEKTIAQLASIRYQHNARGQVVIESKEEARKRGVRSPDRAEAVMLAFAPEIPREVQGVVYYYDPTPISPV